MARREDKSRDWDARKRRTWQFVLIVNLAFLVCSAVAFGFALWLRFDPVLQSQLGSWGGSAQMHPPVLLLLIVSVVMIVTGIAGLVASCKSARHVLLVYLAVLLLLVVVGHFGAGLWAYRASTSAADDIDIGMSVRVLSQYGRQDRPELSANVDAVQQKFRCCGVQGPSDWARSFWVHNEVSISMKDTVPESCCKENKCQFLPVNKIHPDQGALPHWNENSRVFTEGCAGYLREVVGGRLLVTLLLGAVIAAVELLALLVTALLVCFLLPRRRRAWRQNEENGELVESDTLEKSMLNPPAATVPTAPSSASANL